MQDVESNGNNLSVWLSILMLLFAENGNVQSCVLIFDFKKICHVSHVIYLISKTPKIKVIYFSSLH